VLGSWTSVKERDNEFFAWLLALEVAMIGVFLAFDILLFYVFFELTLIPLFFLIGIWGGPQRQYAAVSSFYTLTGSLITLLGVLAPSWPWPTIPMSSRRDRFTPPPNAVNELTFSIPRLVELVPRPHGGLAAGDYEQGPAPLMRMNSIFKRDQEQLKRAQDRLAFWRWWSSGCSRR